MRDPLYHGHGRRARAEPRHRHRGAFRRGRPGWLGGAADRSRATNRDFRRARKGRGAHVRPDGAARGGVGALRSAGARSSIAFQQRGRCGPRRAAARRASRGASTGYEQLKQRAGALDFVDLLLRARDLLAKHRTVREAFQSRFAHLFVDEFQDTDPLQAEILLLLAADDPAESDWRRITPVPGKLFIVGDPKQAIYRFRRADVETYQRGLRAAASRAARSGRSCTRASAPRRRSSAPSTPRFAPADDGDRADAAGAATWRCPRIAQTRRPSPRCRAPGAGAVRQAAGRRLRDRGLAARRRSARSSRGCSTRAAGRSPSRPTRDELPMECRSRRGTSASCSAASSASAQDVTRPYVEALEARGVPHLLVGGKSFHGREEVETLRAALAAIEWPDDELSVFATLRGALFAIDDETLLAYRHSTRVFHPFRVPRRADAGRCVRSSTRWRCCGACTAGATTARSPTPSRSC